MKNNGWLGFIAGAAIGAGIVWLFTSREGKEFMEKMKNMGEDLRDEAEKEWEELKKHIDGIKNDING